MRIFFWGIIIIFINCNSKEKRELQPPSCLHQEYKDYSGVACDNLTFYGILDSLTTFELLISKKFNDNECFNIDENTKDIKLTIHEYQLKDFESSFIFYTKCSDILKTKTPKVFYPEKFDISIIVRTTDNDIKYCSLMLNNLLYENRIKEKKVISKIAYNNIEIHGIRG